MHKPGNQFVLHCVITSNEDPSHNVSVPFSSTRPTVKTIPFFANYRGPSTINIHYSNCCLHMQIGLSRIFKGRRKLQRLANYNNKHKT